MQQNPRLWPVPRALSQPLRQPSREARVLHWAEKAGPRAQASGPPGRRVAAGQLRANGAGCTSTVLRARVLADLGGEQLWPVRLGRQSAVTPVVHSRDAREDAVALGLALRQSL